LFCNYISLIACDEKNLLIPVIPINFYQTCPRKDFFYESVYKILCSVKRY